MGFDDFVVFGQRFFQLSGFVQLERGLERLFDLERPRQAWSGREDAATAAMIATRFLDSSSYRLFGAASSHERFELIFEARIQLHRFFEILSGLIGLSLAQPDDAAIGVNLARSSASSLMRLVVIFHRVVVFAEQGVGVGPVVIELGVFRIRA